MILTQAQAKAVYDAMCALNNSGGLLHARFVSPEPTEVFYHVKEYLTDEVRVWKSDALVDGKSYGATESYSNQHAFAAAYGVGS